MLAAAPTVPVPVTNVAHNVYDYFKRMPSAAPSTHGDMAGLFGLGERNISDGDASQANEEEARGLLVDATMNGLHFYIHERRTREHYPFNGDLDMAYNGLDPRWIEAADIFLRRVVLFILSTLSGIITSLDISREDAEMLTFMVVTTAPCKGKPNTTRRQGGVHFHFPNLLFDDPISLGIRDLVIRQVDHDREMFDLLALASTDLDAGKATTLGAVFDSCVYAANGVRVIGAAKPDICGTCGPLKKKRQGCSKCGTVPQRAFRKTHDETTAASGGASTSRVPMMPACDECAVNEGPIKNCDTCGGWSNKSGKVDMGRAYAVHWVSSSSSTEETAPPAPVGDFTFDESHIGGANGGGGGGVVNETEERRAMHARTNRWKSLAPFFNDITNRDALTARFEVTTVRHVLRPNRLQASVMEALRRTLGVKAAIVKPPAKTKSSSSSGTTDSYAGGAARLEAGDILTQPVIDNMLRLIDRETNYSALSGDTLSVLNIRENAVKDGKLCHFITLRNTWCPTKKGSHNSSSLYVIARANIRMPNIIYSATLRCHHANNSCFVSPAIPITAHSTTEKGKGKGKGKGAEIARQVRASIGNAASPMHL
jgi:hypothetical protein